MEGVSQEWTGPKFGIVLVVVLVLGALGFRDRKETDVLQLICFVSLIAKRSGFSSTRTTTSTRTTSIRNLGLIVLEPVLVIVFGAVIGRAAVVESAVALLFKRSSEARPPHS
jgi:hypothetical protein